MRKKYLALVVCFYAVNLLLAIYHPWTRDFLLQMAFLIPLGVILYGAGRLAARLIRKWRRTSPDLDPKSPHPLRDVKFWIVLAVANLALFVPHTQTKQPGFPAEDRFLVMALTYYALIGVGTILLGLWARTTLQGALWFVVLFYVCISCFSSVEFLVSPGVDFRYGPEKVLFALDYQIQRNNVLALDLGWASFVWFLASALRSNKSKAI